LKRGSHGKIRILRRSKLREVKRRCSGKSVFNDKSERMTFTESKGLKKGSRVYWRGDPTDGGRITGTSWDAVTIAWDNSQVAIVHHGDMSEIQRSPAKFTTVHSHLLAGLYQTD